MKKHEGLHGGLAKLGEQYEETRSRIASASTESDSDEELEGLSKGMSLCGSGFGFKMFKRNTEVTWLW